MRIWKIINSLPRRKLPPRPSHWKYKNPLWLGALFTIAVLFAPSPAYSWSFPKFPGLSHFFKEFKLPKPIEEFFTRREGASPKGGDQTNLPPKELDPLQKNKIAGSEVGKSDKSTITPGANDNELNRALYEITGHIVCDVLIDTITVVTRKAILELNWKAVGIDPTEPITKEKMEKISNKMIEKLVQFYRDRKTEWRIKLNGELVFLKPICAATGQAGLFGIDLRKLYDRALKPAAAQAICNQKELDKCIEQLLFSTATVQPKMPSISPAPSTPN